MAHLVIDLVCFVPFNEQKSLNCFETYLFFIHIVFLNQHVGLSPTGFNIYLLLNNAEIVLAYKCNFVIKFIGLWL